MRLRQNARRIPSVVLVSSDLGSLPCNRWGKIRRRTGIRSPWTGTGRGSARWRSARTRRCGTVRGLLPCRSVRSSRVIQQASVPSKPSFPRTQPSQRKRSSRTKFRAGAWKSLLRRAGLIWASRRSASGQIWPSSAQLLYSLASTAWLPSLDTRCIRRGTFLSLKPPGIANRPLPSTMCLLLSGGVSGTTGLFAPPRLIRLWF